MDEKVTFSLDNKSQLVGSNKCTKEKPELCFQPVRNNNKTTDCKREEINPLNRQLQKSKNLLNNEKNPVI